MEEDLIRKIKGGTNALKNKTKTLAESNLAPHFLRLKVLNIGMYEELLAKYKQVLIDLKK